MERHEAADTWFCNVLFWTALAGSHREAAREFDAPGLERTADRYSAIASAELNEWIGGVAASPSTSNE